MNKYLICFLFLSNTVFSQIEPKKVKNDTVYVNPEFPGGQNEMFKFIGKNLKYPSASRDKGIMGIIYIGFVVDSTGKIENQLVKAQRLYKLKRKNRFSNLEKEEIEGDADLAEECLKVVRAMPKWKPGSMNGKIVRVAYTLPMRFEIN